MIVMELRPNGRQKSFYGKAQIIICDNWTALKSYDTFVCRVVNGKLEKLWDGYSATTMRHINDFLDAMGIQGGGKNWWCNLPIVR